MNILALIGAGVAAVGGLGAVVRAVLQRQKRLGELELALRTREGELAAIRLRNATLERERQARTASTREREQRAARDVQLADGRTYQTLRREPSSRAGIENEARTLREEAEREAMADAFGAGDASDKRGDPER